MSAIVLDIFCERERRSQSDQQAKLIAHQWEVYGEVVEQLHGMPSWMLLKVMTVCRLRLKDM